MATRSAGLMVSRPTLSARQSSLYDWVSDGFVNGMFFRTLLLVASVQSVLLTPVQGSTPAFLLVLLSPLILVHNDPRYFRLLIFYFGFILLYSIYLAMSLSGYMIDAPDMSRLVVIREIYITGHLKQSHVTQGVYLLAAAVFSYSVFEYYQEAFIKYAYIGIIILSIYGLYEFIFYAIFHVNGDFLSNRNFGDLDTAAAGAGTGVAVTGSGLQPSNLFGPAFMRLKSLVGEPSMYALTVTPFAVYAFGRRWWLIFTVLAFSLLLSTSSTAVIGLVVGLSYLQVRRRQDSIIYLAGAAIVLALSYWGIAPIREALDKLIFNKADSYSGLQRVQVFVAHAAVPFDGNPVRALFGLGFGTVRSVDMFSNLLANIGIVGLLLYSFVLIGPCLMLRRSDDRHALVATLLAIFFMEMLSVSEYDYLPPWFMIALGYVRVRQQRLAMPAPNR